MPPVKSKTTKPAKKAVKAKKVAPADVWATIDSLAKTLQETRKETERVMQKTQKIVGNLGNRLGDMAEYSLLPNLPEKFRQYATS